MACTLPAGRDEAELGRHLRYSDLLHKQSQEHLLDGRSDLESKLAR